MGEEKTSTVLIAGGGPSGLLLGLRLAQCGISVTVLEGLEQYADIPKAYAFMPLLFPDFKKAGIWDDLNAASAQNADTEICFRVADAEKTVIAVTPKMPGVPGPMLLSQYKWLGIVVEHFKATKGATLLMGHSVTAIEAFEPEIRVKAKDSSGNEHTFSAKYLIGADGGKSTIRKLCDIKFEGENLPQQLVATDIKYPGFFTHKWDGANFMVDEKYYGLIGPIDNHGLWRVSFGLPAAAAESQQQIDAAIPEWMDAMLPGRKETGAPEYEVMNVAPYRAQQLCATTFRKGNTILIGDAAHLTNPYIGMGLATGLLDATSLTEALVAVIKRGAPDSLLDEWAEARRKVFMSFIDPLSRKAFASVQNSDRATFPDRHPLLAKARRVKAGLEKPGPMPVATNVTSLKSYVAA